MFQKVFAAVATLALLVALPAGSAFALNSPALNSPALNSPALNSPALNSPNLNSPTLNSPNLNSPSLNSPALNSPALNSPALNSPALNSPELNSAAGVVSNASDNAIVASASSVQGSVDARTGLLMSPHSGALNFMAIAAGTALAFIGAIGACIAIVAVARKKF